MIIRKLVPKNRPRPSNQVTLTFTFAEISQLNAYIRGRDIGSDCGWYYGDKEQFELRHAALKKKLFDAAK